MLVGERRTSRERWIWILILALSPLAGLGGILLQIDRARHDGIFFELDRQEAILTTRAIAREQGLMADDWSAYASPKVDDQLNFYFRDVRDDVVQRIRHLAPEVVTQVSLIPPDGGTSFKVELSTDGRLLSYSRPSPGDQAQVSFVNVGFEDDSSKVKEQKESIDRESAAAAAKAAFEERFQGMDYLQFEGPDRDVEEGDQPSSIDFTWLGKNEEHPELRLRYTVTVHSAGVSGENISAHLENEFAEEHYPLHSIFRLVASTVMGVVALFLSLYSLLLYLRRSRQGEVSHRRNLLLGGMIAVGFTLVVSVRSIDLIANQVNRDVSHPTFIIALMGICFGYAFVGAYCALMWGSGEGEVREAYPGKLTSLDAFVLGRWLSQNVAGSIVVGTALGLWLLLAVALVQLPWIGSPESGVLQSTHATASYVRFSGVLVLLTPILIAVPIAILGLLVPITFAARWIQSQRRRILFLAVVGTLGCFWFGLETYPFPAGLAVTMVTTAFLLVSFLRFDLLTTIATISAWNAVSNLVTLGTDTAFATRTVMLSGAAILGIVVLEIYFAFNGRRYSEVEVRPLYAEHLAQRQALQAEVSAAREAQLRLAPQSLPDLKGVELAAACRQARSVGGDFYDFLEMGDSKLGIFLAEGGSGGLSAALSIAFAKGLLLPMARRGASVTEMLERLRDQLSSLRENNPQMGVLVAVLDSREGTLDYARLGTYPRLCAYRSRDSITDPESREGESNRLQLQPADRLVFFTDGMAAALEAARKLSAEEWLQEFFSGAGGEIDSSAWTTEFESALQKYLQKARRRGVDDDVSTVLLHFRRQADERREEVA